MSQNGVFLNHYKFFGRKMKRFDDSTYEVVINDLHVKPVFLFLLSLYKAL